MNIINMLKNVAFMVDPGPDENSALWKMLDAYFTAEDSEESKDSICSVEDVLEASDVLSFMQHNHQPLINFLTEKEHLHKLLGYITTCPDSNTNLSQKSCKILCHNFASVREAVFVDATENLDILFGFKNEDDLTSEQLLNIDALHSGLLTQVVQKFLNTHNWYMVDYFSSKTAFKENPNQLLKSPGLLHTLVDTNYCYSGSALGQWLESINIIQILVNCFNGNAGANCITSSSSVIENIILSVSPLLLQLENQPMICQLLEDSFNSSNPHTLEAQKEVIVICTCLAQKYEGDACKSIPESLIPIIDHIEAFNAILAPSEDGATLVNTSGNIVPFGMKRMKVVQLYKALLNIKCDQINQVLLEKNVFLYLIDSFFLYKLNNILQTSVMSMFDLVVTLNQPEFCKKVLEQTNLIQRTSKLLLEDLQRERNDEPVSAYRGFFRSLETTFRNLQSIGELSPIFDSCEEWKTLSNFTTNSNIDEEAQTVNTNIFGGLSFTLELGSDELYSSLKIIIENNGGTVVDSIDNDCFALVSGPLIVEKETDLAKKANECNIPIISQNFIKESVEQKSLSNTEDFIISVAVSSTVVEKNIEPMEQENEVQDTDIVVNTDEETIEHENQEETEKTNDSNNMEESTPNEEESNGDDDKNNIKE